MSKYIHKYRYADICALVSYCGVLAWKNGHRLWNKATCPKCFYVRDKMDKKREQYQRATYERLKKKFENERS